MSEFVNRFESENAKLPGTSVKDSMGYFPLSHPMKQSIKDSTYYSSCSNGNKVKDSTMYYPQPPREKPANGPGIDISIHFTKSTEKDAQLRARNEFR